MVKIAASEARKEFAEIVNRVAYGHERVVLCRRGKPVAAVISAQALEALERFEDERETELAVRDWNESVAKGEKPIPFDQFERMLDEANRARGRKNKKGTKRARR